MVRERGSGLVAELAEERLPHGVLDELPELRAVRGAAEEPDGDAEAALVSTTATVRAASIVVTSSRPPSGETGAAGVELLAFMRQL